MKHFDQTILAEALAGLPEQIDIANTETSAQVTPPSAEQGPQYGTTEFDGSAVATLGILGVMGVAITVAGVRIRRS